MVQVPFAVLAVPAALTVRAVRRSRGGPPPSGRTPQPHPRLALGGAHGSAVPAGPAPGRGLAPLPGNRSPDGVRRAGRGSRRSPARPPPAGSGPGGGGGGLLPHRGWTGCPRDPTVGPPCLDDRAPGPGGPRARAHHRPSDRPGDGDAAAASGARGVDHRRTPHRRRRRTCDPDAGLHRGPAGRRDARAGGHHVPGARRPVGARGQDRGRPSAGRRAVRAAGSGTRPAARLRDVEPRSRGASRRSPARARPHRAAGACRNACLPRLVPHRRRPCTHRPTHRGRPRRRRP